MYKNLQEFAAAHGMKPYTKKAQDAWDDYVRTVLVPIWEEEDTKTWAPIIGILRADAEASGRTMIQVLEDDGILDRTFGFKKKRHVPDETS